MICESVKYESGPFSSVSSVSPPATEESFLEFFKSARRIFACAALTCAMARLVLACSSASPASTNASPAFSASAWNLFFNTRKTLFARLACNRPLRSVFRSRVVASSRVLFSVSLVFISAVDVSSARVLSCDVSRRDLVFTSSAAVVTSSSAVLVKSCFVMSSSSSAATSCASVSFRRLIVVTSIATAPFALSIATRDTALTSPVHFCNASSVVVNVATLVSVKVAISFSSSENLASNVLSAPSTLLASVSSNANGRSDFVSSVAIVATVISRSDLVFASATAFAAVSAASAPPSRVTSASAAAMSAPSSPTRASSVATVSRECARSFARTAFSSANTSTFFSSSSANVSAFFATRNADRRSLSARSMSVTSCLHLSTALVRVCFASPSSRSASSARPLASLSCTRTSSPSSKLTFCLSWCSSVLARVNSFSKPETFSRKPDALFSATAHFSTATDASCFAVFATLTETSCRSSASRARNSATCSSSCAPLRFSRKKATSAFKTDVTFFASRSPANAASRCSTVSASAL
mmetsp:Transcript_9981/g.33045  ORF Transcript_9981/g.33045 Transcript_9981/m.33045 type:complete len:529 (-) Transcript_9981:1039-2625(-)